MAAKKSHNDIQTTQSSTPPETDEKLYLGDINLKGQIDSHPVRFWGQMAFYGYNDSDGKLIVTKIDRLSLGETLSSPDSKEQFRALSLAGPLNHSPAKPDQTSIELDMKLDYLGMEEQQQSDKKNEFVFPEVKTKLSWSVEDVSNQGEAILTIALESTPYAANEGWGEVSVARIEEGGKVVFQPVVFEKPEYRQTSPSGLFASLYAHTAPSCQGVQTKPSGWQQKLDFVYELNVVFLLFSNTHNKAGLMSLCQKQLLYACKVWWNLYALKIVAWTTHPNQLEIFEGDKSKAESLGGSYKDKKFINEFGQEKTEIPCVEICLVDKIFDNNHALPAGLTYPRTGANTAYCLLDIEKAQNMDYLLAHELGHILGADDSRSGGMFSGSEDSIMDVRFVANPGNGLPNNTVLNCELYEDGRIWPIAKKIGAAGYFFTVDPFS